MEREKIEEIDKKLNAIFESTEKTRKYFLVTIWITVATFILPLIILAFLLPKIIASYTSMLNF